MKVQGLFFISIDNSPADQGLNRARKNHFFLFIQKASILFLNNKNLWLIRRDRLLVFINQFCLAER